MELGELVAWVFDKAGTISLDATGDNLEISISVPKELRFR